MSEQLGILHGLNRQAMEVERLARLARSKRGLTDHLDEHPTKVSRLGSTAPCVNPILDTSDSVKFPPVSSVGVDSAGVRVVTSGTPVTQPTSATSELKNNQPNDQLQYPKGIIKNTWAFGHDRDNDIKIEEVLQKKDLTVAVLSSFQWHMEWLFSKFNVGTKLMFIMQAKDEATVGILTSLIRRHLRAI